MVAVTVQGDSPDDVMKLMKELAIKQSNNNETSIDREALASEFEQLKMELTDVDGDGVITNADVARIAASALGVSVGRI